MVGMERCKAEGSEAVGVKVGREVMSRKVAAAAVRVGEGRVWYAAVAVRCGLRVASVSRVGRVSAMEARKAGSAMREALGKPTPPVEAVK